MDGYFRWNNDRIKRTIYLKYGGLNKLKRKVIIDTDPGIDDALALIFALKHPELDILGITSVGGNKGIQNTTDNVTRILHAFNADTKVYVGKIIPYSNLMDVTFDTGIDYEKETIHGADGLGSVDLPTNDAYIAEKDAITFILETVEKYPNEVDIITLGPMTNIAYCIDKNSVVMEKVKSIHSMGGGIYRGNRTPVAEFNYWFDPYAVNKVFDLGKKLPVYMVGLDLTHQAIMDMNDLTFMRFVDPYLGGMINEMLVDYVKSYWHNFGMIGAVMHDLTVVVGYVYPELYQEVLHTKMHCVTEDGSAIGQTQITDAQEKNAYIPMTLDVAAYKNRIIEIIFGKENLEKYSHTKQKKSRERGV